MVRKAATLILLLVAVVATQASMGPVPPGDAGGDVPAGSTACADLVAKVCGANGECAGDAWCVAAELLRQQDSTGSRCIEALASNEQYPVCTPRAVTANDCEALIELVCGPLRDGARPCKDDPACVNAEVLAAGTAGVVDAGDSYARCRSAQGESALYPPCPR
jgi:hypothetical protein